MSYVLNLEARLDDLTFIQFHSLIDASILDLWETHVPTLSLNFCLRLPHYIYDMAIDTTSKVIFVNTILPLRDIVNLVATKLPINN